MQDIQDIPEKLWHVRRELNEGRHYLQSVKNAMASREAELSLSAGGKNAEERKAQSQIAMATDLTYCTLRVDADDAARKIADLETEETYLTDLRRATEWAIRQQVAGALRGMGIASDGGDGDMQEALDNAPIDRALFNRPVSIDDEVPF